MFSIVPYRTHNALRHRSGGDNFFTTPFDDFFRSFFYSDDRDFGSFKVDVQDKGDHYMLEADLPGVDRDHVQIDVEDGVMTIKAQMDETQSEDNKNYIYRERRVGSMSRSFQLDGIKEEEINAEFKHGVLRLTLPKVTPTAPVSRRIEIQ